jgi:hypothetical protein
MIGLGASLSFGQTQTKWAQTGFTFLEITSDARSAAIGDAVNSYSGYSGALFHNPATMANMPVMLNSSFSVNTWIADIKHLAFSAMVSPSSGDYGVLGISVQSVDYGKVLGTEVWNNEEGFINTEIFNPSALAVGIGYAKMISDQFSVGGQVKFAYQELGKSVVAVGNTYETKRNTADVIAYDFGTIFKTGVKSITFGMSVRNFSKGIQYEEEQFQLPLLFTLGISANVFDFAELSSENQSLMLSVDATHPRSHPEQVKVGMEYRFMNTLAIRGGYISGNSEDAFTYGLGLSTSGLGVSSMGNVEIDYCYTPFGIFNNVQRFTVQYSL